MSYSRHTWPWAFGRTPWPLLTFSPDRESAVSVVGGSRLGLACTVVAERWPAVAETGAAVDFAVGKSAGGRSVGGEAAAEADPRGGGGAMSLPSLCPRAVEWTTSSAISAGAAPPHHARWKRAVIADLPPPGRGLTSNN